MKVHSLITAGMALAASANAAQPVLGESWTPLFNGKDLIGWDTFLAAAKEGQPNHGLNHDPDHVFTVQQVDGGPVIRVSGQYYGGIITKQEFGNYHLRLQFKWGEKRWPPRENEVRDSGLCYHCVEDFATIPKYPWPRSFEFNIAEHDVGEFWSIEGTTVDAEVRTLSTTPDDERAFQQWCVRNGAQGPRVQFVKGGKKQTFHNGGFMAGGDYEKPLGEWNQLDLYAVGDRAVHVVNGKVALVLSGLRQVTGGKETPLTRGKIELQTEGAEIFYRNIELRNLEQIPDHLLR